MAFIDDFTKKAKDVAYMGANKAKDVAEIAKINMSIAGEQREMEKNFIAIGQWFVSEYEGDLPDAVRVLVEAVSASKVKIEELEASKQAPAKESVDAPVDPLCPICGANCSGRFCPHCGAPMDT